MDTCKSDLINHLEFQENLSLYIIHKLHMESVFVRYLRTRLLSQNSLARKASPVRSVKTNSCVNRDLSIGNETDDDDAS